MEKYRIYAFKIGERIIEIKSYTEQKAMIMLINEYWDIIDDYGKIELCGEALTLKKD